MKNKYPILIVGGDLRQSYCARRLSDAFDVSVLSLPSRLPRADAAGKYPCAVLPVPPLTDDGCIFAPLASPVPAAEVSSMLSDGALLFTGRDEPRLRALFPQCEIIDYMSREEVSLRNAIPTAEGAVKIALEELNVTLNGLPVLIVGLGRIGTALAMILRGFGARVTAAVRSPESAAKAHILGINAVFTGELDGGYRLVFNTAPELVFKKELLERFPAETLFIDLASKPGGIDFGSARKQGKTVIHALGLPGKTAPETAGEIVAETIAGILAERRNDHE